MQERRTDERGLDLSALATVDLYRRNAFRLSGLPVDASLRQIRRKTGEIEAAERIGDDGLIKSDQPFPVKPPPSAETIRTALQRLRDPNQRLLDEWFWLWPIPGVKLDGAKPADVGRAWGERTGTSHAHASTALHNIAVIAHLNVLESGNAPKSIETTWRGVYRRWRKVIDDERCWEWLEHRVAAIADPQLKAGAVTELRQELPSVLLEIHAGLAASVVGWPTRTKLHVNAMRASGFDRELVDRALLGAVQGQVSRLRALADRARDAVSTREPWAGAVRSIVDESVGDRNTLDLIVGLDHPVVVGVTDSLAGALRECVVSGVNRKGAEGSNRPQDYAQAVRWLDQARSIAGKGHVGQQIEADMVTLLTNQVVVTCNAALEKQGAKTYTVDAERRLVESTREPMQRLRKLNRAAHDSLCDEVAGTSFVMLIEYVNHHGPKGADVSVALPGLRKALELAKNPELAGRIRKAINDIEQIARPSRPVVPATLGGPGPIPSEDELVAYLRQTGQERLLDQLGLGHRSRPTGYYCAICGRYTEATRRIALEQFDGAENQKRQRVAVVPTCYRCSRKGLSTRPFLRATLVASLLMYGSWLVLVMLTDLTFADHLEGWWRPLAALPLLPWVLALPRARRQWALRRNVPELAKWYRQGWSIVR